ncbi:MAG TPA: hypothetical protein PKA33_06260 [Amaricoccus sp.]|uniref:hypothetical protein n=1 Tax=Amaricoccus sp. TaxID=1872485 RepID=UPI002CCA38F1|nr:hypothetical protein [Amaricoccus sp.]HMQ93041.1 hypothetical protein [Amaricoccus sp.]HMR53329.1 hypothetical protein [Amaricoccus sp.]HMR59471.1 hypothetical protein [Amaricoccus sp.]HMT98962.1 hypothetical protein [Amaricoccus sp.]
MRPSFAILALVAGALGIGAAKADPSDPIARGAYLATVMDCAGRHIPRGADGAPLVEAGLSGGSVGFEIWGVGVF